MTNGSAAYSTPVLVLTTNGRPTGKAEKSGRKVGKSDPPGSNTDRFP